MEVEEEGKAGKLGQRGESYIKLHTSSYIDKQITMGSGEEKDDKEDWRKTKINKEQ